jgi:hypothetical protein
VNFEAYLSSKKIDSAAFKKAEPVLWDSWRKEFEQVHPNSFTAQKLYLINPIRRKYQQAIEALPEVLKSVEKKLPVVVPTVKTTGTPAQSTDTEQTKPKPVVARPMMKPKLPTSVPSSEATPAETQQASASTSSTPLAKPATAKPVIPKPVLKPKPVAGESINESTPFTDATAIGPPADSKTEQAAVSKPMAKPVIPRPVIKPKPVTEQSINDENTAATDVPAAIAPQAESKTERAAVSKPMAKPVIPRPVIKPTMPAPEAEKKPEQTTEPLHDNTPANTVPAQPNDTPPAKAAKPAIPRPVIKPPKPKTD